MNPRNKKSWIGLAIVMLVAGGVFQSAFAIGETKKIENTLYDRLGGLAPISVVVNDFIDALVVDEVLNENPAVDAARERVPAAYLKYHVTGFVCKATGGPCEYTGRNMKDSHTHLNITEGEWDRMVTIFKETLAKYKVPAKETQELIKLIGTTKADIVVSAKGKK